MLEENEIQVRSSKQNLVQPDGLESSSLDGVDVIVSTLAKLLSSIPLLIRLYLQMTRNPCKVSTDVRKVCYS